MRGGQERAAQMNFNGEVFHRLSDYSYRYQGSSNVLLCRTEQSHFSRNNFWKKLFLLFGDWYPCFWTSGYISKGLNGMNCSDSPLV